jgi:hypothetical protein
LILKLIRKTHLDPKEQEIGEIWEDNIYGKEKLSSKKYLSPLKYWMED